MGRRGLSTDRRFGWLLAACAAASTCANAASEPQILHVEPLRAFAVDRDRVMRKSVAPQLGALKFDAFGRRFELALEPNASLMSLAAKTSAAPRLELYRGKLSDVHGSWARLAVKGGVIQGMIWDGADLYVVEPAERVQGQLGAASNIVAGPVIFRLADVRVEGGAAACGIEASAEAVKAADEYAKLVAELKTAPLVMQAAYAQRALDVSALGDATFMSRFGTSEAARDAILVRLNNVDGIFSSQLGVEIRTSAVFVNDATSDPLSDAASAGALLQELGKLRRRTPELHKHGLTHLFTGRNLDDDTVGIAYVNKLCHVEFGVGLTEVRTLSAWRDSLIAAHEIGHNFGASHDGDPQGSCPATPSSTHLMAANVSGNDQFSECSLNVMRYRSGSAACITALPEADLALTRDLGEVRARTGESFEWRIEAANIGGLTAQRSRAEVFLPPVIQIEDAYVVGGSCTSGAGVVFCLLGDIAGGASRTINLSLRSQTGGAHSASIRIASDNDASLSNNAADAVIRVDPQLDLGVQLEGPVQSAGAPVDLIFSVLNQDLADASAVEVILDSSPEGLLSAATLAGGDCAVTAGQVRCSLASLPAGAIVSGSVRATAHSPGTFAVRATVRGAFLDPIPANNSAELSILVTSSAGADEPPAVAAATGQKKGGGAASLGLLLVLSVLAVVRTRSAVRD